MAAPDMHKVVLCSFSGDVGCNPKRIAVELRRSRPELDLMWILGLFSHAKRFSRLSAGIRSVQLGMLCVFREAATVYAIVENPQLFLTGEGVAKREGQYYMSIGRGVLGIKRLDWAFAVNSLYRRGIVK